jgi:hypothetical protein
MTARRTAMVLAAPGPGETSDKPQPSTTANEAPDVVAEFRAAAQTHALKALEVLAGLMEEATSEAVRVSAANSLIDRAHGRPAQAPRVGEGDDGQGGELIFTWLDAEKS